LWFEIIAPSAEADHWWEKFLKVKGSSKEIYCRIIYVHTMLQTQDLLLLYKELILSILFPKLSTDYIDFIAL
jgi:hypothetical protein